MSWTNGTWADVAIGDTVLGGDGYPWSVTDGLIDFDVYGKGEVLRVTMQRDGAGARTGDVLASKAVKYRATEAGGRYLLSCVGCLRTDLDGPCELHAPVSVAQANGVKLETGTPAAPKVAPYVEYDESERAAASALKGAGLTMTVIERVMTLDGLLEHLEQIHGAEIPDTGKLTRIEYRSRLADLHFELHSHDQERGRPWAPRGRTPHVHPVMDRPMEDATPKSLTRRR